MCACVFSIDILYTLDSASNYSAIQKLKPWSVAEISGGGGGGGRGGVNFRHWPWLQTQDIPMKWEDSYVFYFLNRELKH